MFNRSYHFIPAHRPKLFEKISTLGADAFVFDLEDAVPFDEKIAALHYLDDYFASNKNQKFLVRVNGPNHAFFEKEKELLNTFSWLGIVLPKTEDLKKTEIAFREYGDFPDRKWIALIESPKGIPNLRQIVRSFEWNGIGFGLEDMLCNSIYTSFQLNKFVQRVRTEIALEAFSVSIPAIDTISLDLVGGTKLQEEIDTAISCGMTAKFSIHPNQIHRINEGFSPDSELLALADKYKDELATIDEQCGYFKIAEEVFSPPKIKKLKLIRKFEQQHSIHEN